MNYFNMTLSKQSITLTVFWNGIRYSRVLSKRELVSMIGYQGTVYSGEVSLFCLACSALDTMDEELLVEFLEYTDADWENMWDFVEGRYYDRPGNLVDCRNN